jgi:hypothetical protein
MWKWSVFKYKISVYWSSQNGWKTSSELSILATIFEIDVECVFWHWNRIEDIFCLKMRHSRAPYVSSFKRHIRYHNMTHIFQKHRELPFTVFFISQWKQTSSRTFLSYVYTPFVHDFHMYSRLKIFYNRYHSFRYKTGTGRIWVTEWN